MNLPLSMFYLAMFALASLASGSEVKNERYEVSGVGVARMIHEDLGEPISAPERITVTIKCNKSGKTKQVALFRMCRIEEYEFDQATKTLRLKLISGRVVHNTGEVVCDQIDQKEIELAKSCN